MQQRFNSFLGIIEIVFGLSALAMAVFGFILGHWWLWRIIDGLLAVDGVRRVVLEPWRHRRGPTDSS